MTPEQMFPKAFDLIRQAFKHLGYDPIKRLDTGEFAGIYDYMFTAGIVVGIDATGWRTRYCYESREQAEAALEQWDGRGDPPGPWIKQKPEDRYGPGLAEPSKEAQTWAKKTGL